MTLPFDALGRLPEPGDNVAIAVRRLERGTQIEHAGRVYTLPWTILEGHRFAVCEIPRGHELLSWGLPFGLATRDIQPGDYACNASILTALQSRHVDFALPDQPNFENHRIPYALDPAHFRPGRQVEPTAAEGSFDGFERPGGRGVGTRNYVVVMGTHALAGPLARAVAARFAATPATGTCDGVVAVAHTEGGGSDRLANREHTLRTLAGFMVHPNVAAVLTLDRGGGGAIGNRALADTLRRLGYPLEHVPHRFLDASGPYERALDEATRTVAGWLPAAGACPRSRQPLARLRLALQCGGSDAFSGVSGNPLAGWMARELLRYGGSANLGETDELIGAEPYVLENVRDFATARAFLDFTERFQERAGWHGTSAEGNPSGGNMFRGLYNITVKSIGAARKKPPDVRLDHVIDFAVPMTAPGFYFMESPGNDLEGIAGQVASGCTLILFTTGNGSVTNFPFVPTLKIMTNPGRFRLLAQDMDINAGRYLEGESMDELGRESFERMVRAASGDRVAGERAGHAQVQLWRNWRQNDRTRIADWPARQPLSGAPRRLLTAPAAGETERVRRRAMELPVVAGRSTSRRVQLIVPTSLCASQVARMIALQLNRELGPQPRAPGLVALPHTEGCGVGGVENEEIQLRLLIGHLRHPSVERALLLEHGCEKTHNDAMRNHLLAHGIDPSRFGWASIQMDGGNERVTERVRHWFLNAPQAVPVCARAALADLRVGLLCDRPEALDNSLALAIGHVARALVAAGATLVLPDHCGPQRHPAFAPLLSLENETEPTLEFAAEAAQPGLQLMDTPTRDPVEILSGMAATGVEAILCTCVGPALPAHPFVPVIQAGCGAGVTGREEDFDLVLDTAAHVADNVERLFDSLEAAISGSRVPRMQRVGNTDFQITRGEFGFSL